MFNLLFILILGVSFGEANFNSGVNRAQIAADLISKEDQKTVLFRFQRSIKEEKDQLEATRSFSDPSGQIVAVEKLIYSNGKLKKINLDQKQLNESGVLEVLSEKLKFSYTSKGKTKVLEENLEGTLVSTDQIQPFLAENWEALLKGDTLSIRLPVLDRLETVGFKFFKEKDVEIDGQSLTVIKMKPSSIFIAALVDPILFQFRPGIKRPGSLVRVIGRTVPKISVDGRWKDLDAIMKFL